MSSAVDVYGGDARVTATRSEIERVVAGVWLAELSLIRLQDLIQDWANKVDLARFLLELPHLHARMTRIRSSATHSADSYFSNEVALEHRFEAVGGLVIQGLLGGFAAATLRPMLYTQPADTSVRAIASGELGRRGLFATSPSPSSLQTLVDRLRDVQRQNAATLRIDKLSGNRFVVYLPGTMQWPLLPGKNPADLTSNVQLMQRDRIAAAELAAAKAIKQAGIGAGDKVTFIGYSQGGLVAANLTRQSPSYDVTGIMTVGSPIGRSGIPDSVPVLAIENRRDIVPKLDFSPNADGVKQVTAVVDAGEPLNLIESHRLTEYIDSAREVQNSTDPAVVKVRDQLLTQVRDRGLVPSEFFELKRVG